MQGSYSSGQVKEKLPIEAEITLNDGTVLQGTLFCGGYERLSDVLNDDRAFLPFGLTDGVVTFIAKAAISKIRLIKSTEGGPHLIDSS